MNLFLASLAVLAAGGLASLLATRRQSLAATIGAGSMFAGSLLGLAAAVLVLARDDVLVLHRPWAIPGGSFALRIDGLSAFFLLVVFLLSAVVAIYGAGYARGRRAGTFLPLNLLVACMAMVVAADNAMLFLFAWEGMAIASFFLVGFDHEEEKVRRAAWTYLVATHIGSAFVLLTFVLLGRAAGSLDFARFSATGAPAGLLLTLGLLGFGAKAGIIPVHVWLPEAHPAAPSHVSALMSGVMIKTGIYGLLRLLSWIGPPPVSHALVIAGIGAATGLLGVLLALVQHDLKRLLAYSSVENIGIILLGIGLGELGLATNRPPLAVLGFAGALLHVLNHALFKGLLFLGAGAVLHATGTATIDELGGLAKRMRWTSATFLVGAAAISGLPPLNGFASEFLIYLSSIRVIDGATTVSLVAIGAVVALSLIGGLAATCFVKAFGITFLGAPRTERAEAAHEAGPAMRSSMITLAALCAFVGLTTPLVLPALASPVLAIGGFDNIAAPRAALAAANPILISVTVAAFALVALTAALVLLRRRLLAHRTVRAGVTWDCGYARPTARMQYTGSSFAQPVTDMAVPLLRTHIHAPVPAGLHPKPVRLETHTPDPFTRFFFAPLFRATAHLSEWLHRLQQGRTHLYVLYILATLVVLILVTVH